MKAIYIGDEFPEYVGMPCEVTNDEEASEDFPCYAITFFGETEVIGNIDDDDLEFI